MSNEHPFAPYIRILGKGRNGSRALTEEEAFEAMRLIMMGEVEEVQLGAFLMLMRVKEESGAEVAGFVRAIRETMTLPQAEVDLDWSTYAGKRRHLPWFILSALLLAQNGVRIFMHGASGHTEGRIYTEDTLRALGLPISHTLDEAAQQIAASNFAYLPLADLNPTLHQIIELRPLLGLRSPVHTISRMLNPFDAPHMVQGIFHPGYREIHQEAAQLLEQPHMIVFKGEGGEIELNPERECLVKTVTHGEMASEEWPAIFTGSRQKGDTTLDIARLAELWRGDISDEYAETAIIGTTAILLKLLNRATDQANALDQARTLWQQRDSERPALAL